MNLLRILINIVLTIFCFSSGIYLLGRRSFLLHIPSFPQGGTRFAGAPLYLLAFGLLFLGAFAAAVLLAWLKGTLPMPGPWEIRPHPAYKGRILVRYWYFVLPAFVLLISALLMAKHSIGA